MAHVFGQPLITLKWRANANTGSTWMGPLAADLNNDGLMEIVITGMNGIAALNPLNGSVIWSQPYGGDHVPCEIIDLDKDGIPEILMGPQYINGSSGGVLALHGNNGSVYWYNPNAACKGTYIAVADINADGYPEIYSALPSRVTALTYDGRIFASTYTYYPCWGGLTIGDTDFDGIFEVYLGERSNTYPAPSSPGRGIRAFWADNLTEIWCDPDILCSSQTPVLADVDKDGDLEIVILHQRKGIAVYNTDGSVNTYKGIYRKQLSIPALPSNGHTNPTVGDVDDDGNLELIQCGDASHNWYPPAIWDLVNWKLDAKLPFQSMDPPGVVDIDGDGKMEIVAPNQQNVTIFKYNKATAKYDTLYTIPLPMAHPFFIAQDIDGDGKLELVFNQYNSWISVYDVETPAPTPLPRSGLYFYSQYRTRVPVYVPPPGPQEPRITEIQPDDGATNVPVTLSQLSFKLTDYQSDPMNYTVTTYPNIGSVSGINIPNRKITVPVSGLTYSTTYSWTVTATDGTNTKTKTFTFTTEEAPVSGENVVLTISTVGNGSVIKNPDNETYTYGTLVQLIAEPDAGYTFSHWEGDLTGSSNPVTVLMDENKTAIAVFIKTEYTLTLNKSPIEGGSVQVNKTAPYYYGDIVELTAVPNAGWSFSQWLGALTGSQNPATIIIDDNKTVTAVFTQDQYTLTITRSGNGNVTVEPNKATYIYGENVTLTATADPDWTFAGWSGDVSSSENPITITMDSNKSITAVFTQKPYTLTIIIIGNGTVNKNPDHTLYAEGETVTLTAIPDAGWKFVEWGGNISSSENPTSIIMDGNKTVYVTFTQEQYTLIVHVEGLGNVTKTPDWSTYTYGTQVQLTASADIGWNFSYWSFGNIMSLDNPLTFIITGNMTITAHFQLKQYTIMASVSSTGGTIEPSGIVTVTHGEDITFTVTPYTGYHILNVLVDGEDKGAISIYTFYAVNTSHTITAIFAPNEYTLTVNVYPEESGTVIVNNTGPYHHGDVVQLTAEPSIGWYFSQWQGDISGRQNTTIITIDGDKSITAVFTQEKLILNVTIIGKGSVIKEPNKTVYTRGETVTLTVIAGPGWTFSGWSGNLSGLINPVTITMSENITVTATFTANKWWCRDWEYRKTITIDYTKVSGTLTDFPVLIEILDSSLVGKTQPNGYDFVFTDANNVKLNHQIEFYDSTIGYLIVWVKVPYLSSTTDTILYMYYGNPTCENQQNPTAVWDTDYMLVLHLNENTSTLYDSTMNENNGTPFNGVLQGITGKIDGAATFDGSNDYIQIPHSDTLAGYTEALTVSFWIRLEDTSRRQTILCKYDTAGNMRSWQIEYDTTNWQRPFWFFASQDGMAYSEWWTTFMPQANAWYYVTIVWETNAIPKFYVNGVQVPTVGTDKISSIFNNVGVPLRIARSVYSTRFLKGSLDEITISNQARSADWILTTYNNQLNPSAFYSIGPEEVFEETYVLTITADGNGSVDINPEKVAYKQGENVTLTAFPDEGYEFAGWTGDIESNENPLTVTMTKSLFIMAHFTLKQYVINASVSGVGGTIQPSGAITVYHGENITFTITPETGYHIYDIIVDGISQGPVDAYTFYPVNASHTIIAFFTLNEYALTVNLSPIEGGTVNLNKTAPYNYGDVVELTAVPAPGWSFTYWEGDLSGNQTTAIIVMDGNKTVTAVFTQNQYALNITIIGNGNVSKNPDKETYIYGENVTLTATPESGWFFAGWSGDASGTEFTITITIYGDKSVTATFNQEN
jgi:hypothetical protein